MSEDKALYPPVSAVKAGLSGKCPRCGTGRLFNGYFNIAKGCSNCGLDYSFAEGGNGPDSLVILVVAFIVMGLALYTEVNFNPPLWLHFLMWIPLVLILTPIVLRSMKGLLIGLQYKNKTVHAVSEKN
jgi:uncharacterized protein (DUF983 family)